jgi:hypothetical protein
MKPLCHPQGHIGLASQVELGSLNVLNTKRTQNTSKRAKMAKTYYVFRNRWEIRRHGSFGACHLIMLIMTVCKMNGEENEAGFRRR